MLNFEEEEVSREAKSLPIWKRRALLLLLGERMLPLLHTFGHDVGFDTSHYDKCFGMVWNNLDTVGNSDLFQREAKQCFDLAPDMDDFDHPLKSGALNACLMIGFLLEYMTSQSDADFIESVKVFYESAFMRVQQLIGLSHATKETTKSIFDHRFMQQELLFLRSQINFLKRPPSEFSAKTLDELRAFAKNNRPFPIQID